MTTEPAIARLVAAWIEAERDMAEAYRVAHRSMDVARAARAAVASAIFPFTPEPGVHRVLTCGAITVEATVAEDGTLTLDLCYPEPPPPGAAKPRLRIVP